MVIFITAAFLLTEVPQRSELIHTLVYYSIKYEVPSMLTCLHSSGNSHLRKKLTDIFDGFIKHKICIKRKENKKHFS